MNAKVFTRALGVVALLALALGLTVSTLPALGSPAAPSALAPLAEAPLSRVNDPQDGGPVPGGPGHVVLNAFDFKPYSQTATYQYSGTLLENTGSSYTTFIAQVHLPQGATITQVVAYYSDKNLGVGMDLAVDLLLCNDLASSAGIMASLASSGGLAVMTYTLTSAINLPIVDNSIYSYAVQVGLPNTTSVGFSAVRIDYSYPVSLTMVGK